MKERLSFTWDLFLQNPIDSYLCLQLVLLHSFFSSIDDLFRLYAVFDAISSNIDEVYSINPYANLIIFGDFNVHHKDWLAYSKLLGWLTFILESLLIVNINRPSFIHLHGFSS